MTDININELLTYVCHYIDNSTINNVKKVIEFFYSEDEILVAKQLLWDVASENLEPIVVRKTSNKRTCAAASIDDIFDAVTKLDSENKLPRFVASDLARLPDRQPEELNLMYIIERVATIENKIKSQEDIINDHAIQILKLNDASDLCSQRYSKNHVFNTYKSKCKETDNKNNYSNDESSSQFSQLVDNENSNEISVTKNRISETLNNQVSNNIVPTPGMVKKYVNKINEATSDAQLENTFNAEHNKNDKIGLTDETSSDEDGFTKVESKYARKKRLRNLLGAPTPVRYAFINRVATGNPNMIAEYLNDNKVNFEKIERKSHPNSKYKSFKVTMYKVQIYTVLSKGFWPTGVRCKIWKEPSSISSDVRLNKNRNNSLYDSRYIFSKNLSKQLNKESFNLNRKSFSNY